MKKSSIFLLLGISMVWAAIAFADEQRGTAAQAKLMVEKAVEYVNANGKDKAVAEFNNPQGQFVKGDLYVYAWDLNGNILAHPTNPGVVGKNNTNVPDEDGKFFRKEAVEMAKTKGAGWVDYKYMNPKTHKVEQKTTYVKKVGEIIVACGAYK